MKISHDNKLLAAIFLISLLMAVGVLLGGCATVKELYDEYKTEYRDRDEPEVVWRQDLAEIRAKDGVLTFRTRNLSVPSGDGKNRDGGMEWIIARVHGQGYGRLLIMVMGGNRPASRIYFDGDFVNSRWQMPMMQDARWEVSASGGVLRIKLDGNEIWSRAGGYSVTHAAMNGYPNRHSTGEWSAH